LSAGAQREDLAAVLALLDDRLAHLPADALERVARLLLVLRPPLASLLDDGEVALHRRESRLIRRGRVLIASRRAISARIAGSSASTSACARLGGSASAPNFSSGSVMPAVVPSRV
jgi:hypothetical protein